MIHRPADAPELSEASFRGRFVRAWAVSLVLAVLCAAGSCALNAGEEKDTPKGPEHSVTLNEEPGVLDLLKKAQKAREKAEHDPQAWPECVKHYSEILRKYPNTVYLERWEGTDPKDPAAMAWKNGLYKSTRERVARDIASLPAGGLSIYRVINDPPARGLYAEASENFDERKMEQVAQEYFPTSFGDDALAWLAELAYDRNAPRLSLMRLNQVLDHPSASMPRIALLARKALVLAKAGDLGGALVALKETEDASADPKNGELAVGHRKGVDALTALKEQVTAIGKRASKAPVAEASGVRNWETYYGNAAHNAQPPERKAVGLLKWSVATQKLLYGPNADEEPPRRIGDMNGNPIPDPTIPYNLTIHGDHFFINDYLVMAAYPVNNPRPGAPGNGNAVFFYPSDPNSVKAGGVRDRNRRLGRLYGTFVRHHPHFVTLTGEGVFGAVGAEPANQDPQMWGGGQEQNQPANYMVSLSKSGKLKWALTPDVKDESFNALAKADQEWLRTIFFPCAPTYDSGVLYAMAAKTSGLDEAWACAFDAENGRLLWRTLLCSANPVLVGGPVQPDLGLPVAVSNNTVFIVTNLGTVAAIDALSGGIKWLRVYDRAQVQERFARFGRGRSDFWAPNPPIVHDRVVICTPQDSDVMYAYDIETGRRVWEVQRVLPNDRDRLKHVLGIVHNALVVSGNDIHFFGLKSGPEVFVIDQLESPVKGRGAVAGNTVLVPTEKSLLALDTELVENRVRARIREQYKWVEPEKEAGNVFVAGDVLYTISNTHVNAYFVWQEVERKLRERIHKDASDLPSYLELADTYLKVTDFDSGLKLVDQALAAAGPRKDDPKVAPLLTELNRKKYELLLGKGDAARAKTENDPAYAQFKSAYETALLPGLSAELAVAALARMAETSKAQNEMARAVGHYHDMIQKHGDVTIGEAPNQQRARLMAQSKIEEIRKLDPKAYAKVEAEARLALEQAGGDAAKLLNVVMLFPNSSTSGEALLKLARSTLAKRPDQARQHLQRYLSRFASAPEAPQAQALMALAYEKSGLLGPAKDILLRLARPEFEAAKIPGDPANETSAAVTVPAFAKQKLADPAYQKPLSSSTASLGDGKLKESWKNIATEVSLAVQLDGTPPGVMRRNVFLVEQQSELVVLNSDGSEEWTPRPKLPAGVYARGIWADHLLLFVGTREVVAYDSNERGRIAWRRELNIPNTRQLQCAVKAAAGRVVIAYPSGGVSVLDAANGEVLWHAQLDGNQLFRDPAVGDGFIAVAAQNPARVHLFELDTGKKRGAIDQAAGGFSVAPVAQGDRAYFAERNVVKAVEGSTGKLAWEHTLGGEATALFAGREWVIVGSDDRERPVLALSTDGAGERKVWAPVLPRGCRARGVHADGDDLLVMLDSPGGKAALYSFSISKQGKLNWEVELSKEAAAALPLGENTLAVGHALTTQANWDPTGDRPSALVLVDRRSGKLSWSADLSSDGLRNFDENGAPMPNFAAQLFDGGVLVIEGRKRTIFVASEARADEDTLKAFKEQLSKNPGDPKLRIKLAQAQFASTDPAQKEAALALQGEALASGKLSAAEFNEAYAELLRMRSDLTRSRKRRMEFAKATGDVDAALKNAPEILLAGWRDVYLQRDDESTPFASDGFNGDADLKASFRGAYDATNLYLHIAVTDDTQKNEQTEGAYCDLGDSVRLVFDIDRDGGLGYRGDDFEMCAGLNAEGKVLAWRFVERGRYLGADAALNPAPSIVRDEASKTTTYRFTLPLEYLKLKAESGAEFGFSFGVNDQDGTPAVKKSMSATPGVQRPPYPGLFGEGVLK